MYLLVISALAAALVSTKPTKPRSVNVAVETVLEFENDSDLDVLNNLQGFLDGIRNLFGVKRVLNDVTTRNERHKPADLLQEAVTALKEFNDRDLIEVFQILAGEIRKSGHKNDEFAKHVARYLTNKFGGIEMSAGKIRRNLDNVLRKLRSHKDDRDHYSGFLKRLYKRDFEEMLAKLIRKLKIFRRHRKRLDLQRAIRKAVQLIFFNNVSAASEDAMRGPQARAIDNVRDDFRNDKDNEMYTGVRKTSSYLALETSKAHTEIVRTDAKTNYNNIEKSSTSHRVEVTPVIYLQNSEEISEENFASNETMSVPAVKRNTRIKHTNKKLVHKAVEAERVKIESGAITPFRSAASKDGKLTSNERDNLPENAAPLASTSQSTEVNENFDGNYYTTKKIRAFRQSTKNNKADKVAKAEKPEILLTIPKTNVRFVGNLYKTDDKIRSKYSVDGNNEKPKQIVTEIDKKNDTNDDTSISSDLGNFMEKPVLSTEKMSDETRAIYENDEIGIDGEYRRANKEIVRVTDGSNTNIMYTVTPERRNLLKKEQHSKQQHFRKKNAGISTKDDGIINTYYAPNIITYSQLKTNNILPKPSTITDNKISEITKDNDGNEIASGNTSVEIYTKENVTNVQGEKIATSVNEVWKTGNAVSRDMNDEAKTTSQIYPVSFDLNNYLKTSEVKDIEDVEKKNAIERKMKEDLENLLFPSTNATTTEAYADIFEALEDDFDLKPLK